MKKKLSNKSFFEKTVVLQKIKKIKQSKGDIHKFVDISSPMFKKFGEIYFTEVKKKSIKGWKKHKKNFSLIKIIIGKIKFMFFSNNALYTITLKDSDNMIIQIPPKIWFSFEGMGKKNLLSNMIDNKHSDNEVDTISIRSFNKIFKDNEIKK